MKTIVQSTALSLVVGALVALVAQAWGLGQLSALLLISLGIVLAGVPVLIAETRAGEHRGTRVH